MLKDIMAEVIAFRDARNWKRFHSARTLSASVVIEATELLEIFQWTADHDLEEVVKTRREAICDEVADVLIYTLMLMHDLGLDPEAVIAAKLQKNAEKYPAPK